MKARNLITKEIEECKPLDGNNLIGFSENLNLITKMHEDSSVQLLDISKDLECCNDKHLGNMNHIDRRKLRLLKEARE